jgi:hypothetical protein
VDGLGSVRQVRPIWDATGQEPDMQTITVVGVDIAKSVFQVHAIGADGQVAIRRRLRRGEVTRFFQGPAPCWVGMCASAHHWAREITAFRAPGAVDAGRLCQTLRQARED